MPTTTPLRISRALGAVFTSAMLLAPLANCSSEIGDDEGAELTQGAATAAVTIRPVRGTSKCFDVAGWNQNNGARAILWDCHGGANQQFTYQDGFLKVFGNKCLDVMEGANQNGTRLQIWDCTPGNTNQQWVRDGQQWKWKGTNKCIDLPWGDAKDGNFLQIWDCVGNDFQKWNAQAVGGGSAGGGGGSTGDKCSGGDLAKCNCPSNMFCCPTDGSCFESADKVVFTKCKDTPANACSMSGQSGGGGGATPPPTPPPPSGGGGGNGSPDSLPTRLRIRSQCADPIWIAHSDNVPDKQNVRLTRGQSYDYNIPSSGLAATRFWPKQECDGNGQHCAIGDSGEGGGKPCPANGCQPPIDSKFEATFDRIGGTNNTWYNLSQVDGYTLPFKVVPHGKGIDFPACKVGDGSRLSLAECPTGEDIKGFGSQDLRVRDGAGKVIGCMAPCKKLNYPAPWGLGRPEDQGIGLNLCCPTDPNKINAGNCNKSTSCMTPQACSDRNDPDSVEHTDFVNSIRKSAGNSIYTYAYDDANGLHQCPAETQYEVIFCP